MDESDSVTLEILTDATLGRQERADAGEFFRSTLPRLRDEFERHRGLRFECWQEGFLR